MKLATISSAHTPSFCTLIYSSTRELFSELTVIRGQRALDIKILCSGREVSVETFPIGVDPSEFQGRLRNESVQEMIRTMRHRLQGLKIIIGVDRLDIIKGVPHKLRAFERFLERYPEWIGRLILVQLVVPSRANLEANQRLRREIQHIAGLINDKYGTFELPTLPSAALPVFWLQ